MTEASGSPQDGARHITADTIQAHLRTAWKSLAENLGKLDEAHMNTLLDRLHKLRD